MTAASEYVGAPQQRRITGRPLCRNQYNSSVGSGPQSSYEYSGCFPHPGSPPVHSGASRRSRAASPSRSTVALARGSSPPCPSRTSGTPSWPTKARVHQPRRRHQPQGTDATAPTPKGLKSDRAVGRYLSGAKFREAITGATTLDETQNPAGGICISSMKS